MHVVGWILLLTPPKMEISRHSLSSFMFSQHDRQNLSCLQNIATDRKCFVTVVSWPLHPQSNRSWAAWMNDHYRVIKVKMMKYFGKASIKQHLSDAAWFPLFCWPVWRRERERKWALAVTTQEILRVLILEREFGKHRDCSLFCNISVDSL